MSAYLLVNSAARQKKVIRDNQWTAGCPRCYPVYEWSTDPAGRHSILTVTHESGCKNTYSGGRFAVIDHPRSAGTKLERLSEVQ